MTRMKFYNDTQIIDSNGGWCKRIDLEKLIRSQNKIIENQSSKICELTHLSRFQDDIIKSTSVWIEEFILQLTQLMQKMHSENKKN